MQPCSLCILEPDVFACVFVRSRAGARGFVDGLVLDSCAVLRCAVHVGWLDGVSGCCAVHVGWLDVVSGCCAVLHCVVQALCGAALPFAPSTPCT